MATRFEVDYRFPTIASKRTLPRSSPSRRLGRPTEPPGLCVLEIKLPYEEGGSQAGNSDRAASVMSVTVPSGERTSIVTELASEG